MRFRAVAIFVLTAAVVAGCAVSSARGYTPRATVGTGAPAPSLPPTVSASATMLPGNVVPFVDEPAAESEFVGTLPTQPNPPRPSGPRCEGSQLRGALSKWISKSVNNDGEKMDPVMAASLSGWVVVTNTSNKPCTLQGRVNAQLVDGGGELHIDYSNDINAAAETAVTGVPAGGLASLRLDWSAPFCTTITGPLSVHVVLPNNGGTLDATVRDPTVPGCLHEETHPDLAGGVFVSAFSPGDASATTALPVSPLSVLTTSIVSHPTKGSPGKPIRYVVAVTNPTSNVVSLGGSVGFSQFIASRGGDGVTPFQYGEVFRLNRRVVAAIPAHQTVRYEMLLVVPPTMKVGLTMNINWLLAAPWLTSKADPTNGFVITIA